MTTLINFDQYGFICKPFNWKRLIALLLVLFLVCWAVYQITRLIEESIRLSSSNISNTKDIKNVRDIRGSNDSKIRF